MVVVDPGHDLRANLATEPIGPGSTVRKIKDGGGTAGEAQVVLAVSLRLRTLLQRAGLRVVMTRTRTDSTSMGNVARARIANRAGAALFLRVHADGSTSSASRGTHTLYPAVHTGWTDDIAAPSLRAARLVQAELVRSLGFPDAGLDRRGDLTGFNWSRPAGGAGGARLPHESDRAACAHQHGRAAACGGRTLSRRAPLPRPPARALRRWLAAADHASTPSSRSSITFRSSPPP